MKIRSPPPVLVLHLKRFSFGGFTGKINKHTVFEEHMQVSHEPDDSGERHLEKYSLIGIVVHHGHSVHSGHYVSFVKVEIFMKNSVHYFP
jgi:ubiquitin carboxyl-terminal hydrolase 36/42